MAWFFFIAPVGTIIVQNLCLALSIYLDARPDPIFPRWVAHFNIAIAALLVPSAFSILYTSGPLAWNGVLSFTLRLSVFAVYIVVMFIVLLAWSTASATSGSRWHDQERGHRTRARYRTFPT